MRILVLNQYFHPDLASSGQLLTELCEDLSEEHDVTVVCGRPSYSRRDTQPGRPRLVVRDRHGRVRVLRTWSTAFPRQHLLGRLSNYATYTLSCLWGAFRASRPDVILTMTDPPLVSVVAAFVSLVRRVPFVYVCQDIMPQNAIAVGQLSEGSLTRILARLNRTLRDCATAVVAIGRDMRDRLVAMGTPEDKIAVIPNWSDGTIVHPLVEPSPLRTVHGWGSKYVVMHSGNVGRAQDLESLVEAAALLRDDVSILFVIIGEGTALAGLKEGVAEQGLRNVVFLPYQEKERLAYSLGAADVHIVGWRRGLAGFATPSKVYGILAAGKPFIAAIEERSEPAYLIEELGCGIRVPPGDPGALADAIRRIRNMDGPAMGTAGRRAFEERYDRPKATAAYSALLSSVAARG